jgi:hypothetical protein
VHHYDHRWATYEAGTGDKDSRNLILSEKQNSAFEVSPRYWVPEYEVAERLQARGWVRNWLMGWRDITNATNERTVVAGAIPRSGVGDKFLLMMPSVDPQRCAVLVAFLSSLTFDFVARQKLGGTSLKYFTMKQLTAPPPEDIAERDIGFVTCRTIELGYTSHAMKPWAVDLGYTDAPFSWREDRRALLRAELDAKIAALYGLTRDQLRYILDPTDVYGPDYSSETFRGLKKNEISKYGEYRTAKLVLDAWDRLERGELK